ncbi:MAG: NADPH-dependent glutamate synthase [Bdellovibrio sp.]|nr:NADPH-dependent glutamate synthase [Bdellovibrio sp.]
MAQFPPVKDRMKMSRMDMPEQDPNVRNTNFEEVALGYNVGLALNEAQRCLQCKTPTCIDMCPVNIKIDQFIERIVAEDYVGAYNKIREDNFLPAICGRVCPQDKQCESTCVLTKKFSSVAIGRLERFVADKVMSLNMIPAPVKAKPTGKKVAIVGSGPAGLACAADLVGMGHEVTVYEALHELGGVLVYGIPEFRLPKAIVRQEIQRLADAGVKFVKNAVIGKTITIDELQQEEGVQAIFIGVGAGLPKFMDIKGEELAGVYSANEFLTRVNLMKAYKFPEFDSPVLDPEGRNVVVVGGGNTAMDAVRTAKRLGAKTARIIYRRSEDEMPARTEEIHHAKQEGVIFQTLTNPLEYLGDKNQRVNGVKLQKMELGEPDKSGRRRPQEIKGSEYIEPIDIAIVAIGNGSNPLLLETNPDIKTNKWGNIEVNPETMETSKKGIFAGGDIVTGGATVILAMGAGRKAAKAMNEYLNR